MQQTTNIEYDFQKNQYICATSRFFRLKYILHPIVTTQNSYTLLTDRAIGGLAL